jgi:outer membrane protein
VHGPFASRAALLALLLTAAASPAEGLLELYDEAMQSNPALRGREFGIEEAKAQRDLSLSQLLPQVTADASYDWNKYDEEGLAAERYQGMRGVLSARQPLLDVAALHRYRSAKVTVEQSEHERAAIEMEVTAELIDRYLVVLQAEDEIAYLASEKVAIEGQLERLRFMRERRLAKLTDLLEVEAYYQGLLTRGIEARNARAIALARLRETTGVAVQQVDRLVREEFPAVPGSEEEWTRDAARTNPNLLALERAAEAARRLVSSSRAQHLPRLALAGTSVYADQGFDNREVPTYQVGSVGFELSVPVFEGGRVQAAVRESRARYNITLEQYEAALREVEGNARSAYLNAIASHARMRSTGEERRAMEKVVEAQEESFELQVTTVLDVLVARRRLTKARSDESKARYDYMRDLSALKAQTGQLDRGHIAEIDGWLAQSSP